MKCNKQKEKLFYLQVKLPRELSADINRIRYLKNKTWSEFIIEIFQDIAKKYAK
jgi:hypothetical protein